ncbi:MAG TPA: 16S rRNA (cytidine(1402)-2'-O)-methyltransferase [Solirubrobacteraceae bacterium]|nr:16S rRNA (cytidine(1402)-2'-O)-methyltransferase [Solirubrobacteraceae bacterium]
MTPPAAKVGRLVVCPTPIGNLDDVTLRVLATLAQAEAIACEDTRHTRRLLERHGIAARLVSVHEHNERARTGELLERVRAGALVALVSDAGTPLVSDPGFALVRECIAAGLALEVLPGPSAALTALVASGLPCERWRFVGFLPRAREQLRALLAEATDTLVAFESPRRLLASLELLCEQDAQRPAAVCRELTKLHEEVRRGSAAELAAHYRGHPPRGEIVLVVGAAPAGGESETGMALQALRELIDAGARARPAATVLARLTGVRANALYAELTREDR